MIVELLILVSVLLGPRATLVGPNDFALIDDERLQELSGLAPSRRNSRRLWAINDSGSEPRLWALQDGHVQGSVIVHGVRNVDWEDLASFEWQGKPYLVIADSGDNAGRRDDLALHIVPEPHLTEAQVAPAWSIRFGYPDGEHDSESVLVDVSTLAFYVISKREVPAALYRLPWHPITPVVAERVALLDQIPQPDPETIKRSPYLRFSSQPTSADLSCDGLTMAVLTYSAIYLYRRTPQMDWAAALAGQHPQRIALPPIPQAEALAFSRNCKAVYVGSEKSPVPILRYQVR